MGPRKVINWLIALAVAAALIASPLSAPAMAASQMAATADEMQATADDMPCCPEQDQKAKDCGSCPFVALCMLTITMPPPGASAAPVDRTISLTDFSLPIDLLIDGLDAHPPDHPPRTIV
jgi:hypothetical protein